MSINDQYLAALSRNPLLTKMATSGALSSLNEIIASVLARQFHKTNIKLLCKEVTVCHPFSSKIASMVIYGGFLSTPVAHYFYQYSTKVFGRKQSPRAKLLQLASTLVTLTPFLSALFVSWLSIINNYKFTSKGLCTELCQLKATVKAGLKNNFWLVYRSSAITQLVGLTLAQKFASPELWVVFMNFIYFLVGTYQNTKFKLKQKAASEEANPKKEE